LLGSFIFGRLDDNQTGVTNSNTTGAGSGVISTNGEGNAPQNEDGGSQGSGEEPAPAPTVTLAGGPAGSGDQRLVFFYNNGGFYAWNAGGSDIIVRELAFQALDSSGNPTGLFFDARRWAGFYPLIQVGKCDRLEILNDVPKERPGQCQGYNAIMTPEETDEMIFWLGGNTTQFIVTFGGQEIGRCEVDAGQCEVVVP
jgi:hypothetical protein